MMERRGGVIFLFILCQRRNPRQIGCCDEGVVS